MKQKSALAIARDSYIHLYQNRHLAIKTFLIVAPYIICLTIARCYLQTFIPPRAPTDYMNILKYDVALSLLHYFAVLPFTTFMLVTWYRISLTDGENFTFLKPMQIKRDILIFLIRGIHYIVIDFSCLALSATIGYCAIVGTMFLIQLGGRPILSNFWIIAGCALYTVILYFTAARYTYRLMLYFPATVSGRNVNFRNCLKIGKNLGGKIFIAGWAVCIPVFVIIYSYSWVLALLTKNMQQNSFLYYCLTFFVTQMLVLPLSFVMPSAISQIYRIAVQQQKETTFK